MKIIVNSKKQTVSDGLKGADIARMFKPKANIIIINGFPADFDTILYDGDEAVLIVHGEVPPIDELEATLSARHTPKIHLKLKAASVAVAGLGGLGSNAAVTLARMGIGKLKLVDFDFVEPSNLNRQYYNITQIGMKKTEALADTIKNINPLVKVETENIKVTELNIQNIFSDYGIILECFDSGETKAIFISVALKQLPEAFIIGASGVAGLFSTELFKIKKLGTHCVVIGDFENEATPGMGLMASRVATAANIQANIALRHILGESNG